MRCLLRYFSLMLGLVACAGGSSGNSGAPQNDADAATLVFTLHQERSVYELSDYGEPPQFAIWLECKKTEDIRTVFVTYRTATGNFIGKSGCMVSLPIWIGAFRKETGRNNFPVPPNPASDAVTGATPQTKEFTVSLDIPKKSEWRYFVEINVAADYTPEFPSVQQDGTIDAQGNGQPSIVYMGEISGTPGEQSKPVLTGRSEQLFFSDEINRDLTGIRNAKDVFSLIKGECLF